jgi:maltooligosyltrehalose trehalohydrolase
MLQEFAPNLKAAEAKLPYLRDLGVTCLEVMPVANVDRSVY